MSARFRSISRDWDRRVLAAAGLELVGEREDEGENHLYLAAKV